MNLSKEQRASLEERNECIADRYDQLIEVQPLATASMIIRHLAEEYELTPQSIGRILRELGRDTTTKGARK